MMARKIGKTRAALPEALVKAFSEVGVTARFSAEALHPATGYWRTDVRADVFRWEGQGEWLLPDGTWLGLTIDSWDTMTDCVKHGTTVEKDGATWLAHANSSRTHPLIQRLSK